MAWWNDLIRTIWRLLDEHGQLVAFAMLFLEEAGIPSLIPGDFLMILIGVRVAQGELRLLEALAVLQAATVLGGTVLYWLAVWGGHPVVERIGPYVGVTPERLQRASDSLRRHGVRAVIAGRFIPGLSTLTTVACGVLDFPFRRFVLALFLGGLLRLLAFVAIGYFVGPPALQIAGGLHLPIELLASLAVLVMLSFWVVRAARRAHADPKVRAPLVDRLRYGLVAGLLGALMSMLLANVLIHLTGLIAYEAPSEALAASGLLGRRANQVLLITMTPAFVALPTLWGALYGVVEPLLPGPARLRGVLFSTVPLAFSLLVVLPLVGGGPFGQELDAGSIPALGEAARYLTYGLTMGATFPILAPRPRPAPSSAPASPPTA